MSEKEPWYIAERATALASLLLTSRKDVAIRERTPAEAGIDLLAEVLKGRASAGRFFGVRVLGRSEPPRTNGTDLGPPSVRLKLLTEPTLPLCAFVLDVRGNRGVYRWVAEPTVEGGEPRLIVRDDDGWAELDERAISDITDRVSAWYDALAVHLRP